MSSVKQPTVHPADPLPPLLRRSRVVLVAGGLVVAATMLWALWPLGTARRPSVTPASTGANAPLTRKEAPQRLDLVAFGAPLWDPLPPPPKPAVAATPSPPPPPPPLRLQLIGVARDPDAGPGGGYLAMVYDEAADKLLMLRNGDAVGSGKVQSVTADRLVLADSSGPRTLALLHPQPAPPVRLLEKDNTP